MALLFFVRDTLMQMCDQHPYLRGDVDVAGGATVGVSKEIGKYRLYLPVWFTFYVWDCAVA